MLTVKWKESGTIPNSFYYGIMFNLSNFWGSLHFETASFFCLIRFGKLAEDNDASAWSVLCFPCENHTFPEVKT